MDSCDAELFAADLNTYKGIESVSLFHTIFYIYAHNSEFSYSLVQVTQLACISYKCVFILNQQLNKSVVA